MNNERRSMLKFAPFAFVGLTDNSVFGQTNSASPVMPPLFFDVRVYGATGSGRSLDSPGINAAIDAAAAAGGGTVVFPAGTYLCFSILRDGGHSRIRTYDFHRVKDVGSMES
jgi:Pectate lyase superfamily protein